MTTHESASDHETRAERRYRVRAFILPAITESALNDDDNLFRLKDSLFAMELLTFVEGTFGIRVGPEDLSIQNFQTVDAICALIDRKLSGTISQV
jgi:methoxymalonate biosynthesis acyl carrier protein